jgi:hypothetical protein
MQKPTIIKTIKIMLIVMLSIGIFVGGKVVAQLISPATEPGGEVQVSEPSYVSGDPAYADVLPPDEKPLEGTNNTAATFSYYQVAGATLRGRNSTTGYVYDGVGCSHTTSGTGAGRILNTELIIPDNSVIKYLRVYYNDTNPSSGVEGYITRYQPGTATVDLVYTGSTDAFSGGYGFSVSQEITETVNNTSYAYTLIGWPDDNNVANQICGLRVAFYAPFSGTVFMPLIKR